MSMTIEQVFAARRAKIEAAKNKKSPLHARLEEIVTLLNGGALWIDILEYLEANDVRTAAGTPISRSPLIDWCSKNVPAYDAEVGTPADVIAGRKVVLNGANRSTRNAVAKRVAGAAGAAALRTSSFPAPAQHQETAPAPARARASRKLPPVPPNQVFSNVPPLKAAPAAGAVGSTEWTANWLARMREDDDSADLSRATGKS
jgi:hypothetical protein